MVAETRELIEKLRGMALSAVDLRAAKFCHDVADRVELLVSENNQLRADLAREIGLRNPPYPGCAHLYKDHPDYAGEVDHHALVGKLIYDFDGYCLHTSSVALADILRLFRIEVGPKDMPRVMAWVKPFAAFKRNVPVAYAWEPVLVRACRKPVVKPGMTYRDWIAESITLKRGLTGAKPERVCQWLFEVMGCEPDDELCDLFPGTGAVTAAWDAWSRQGRLVA